VDSKHALEGMSHSVRRDMQLSGIEVIVAGEEAIKTAIWTKHGT
jgi:NAD(P)-dependent dehydrogenase (short-subunit alcohol dehydrogenase family)